MRRKKLDEVLVLGARLSTANVQKRTPSFAALGITGTPMMMVVVSSMAGSTK
jgi:hypothetical protein